VALPKVIVQLYPVFPTNGEEDRRKRRPVGADSDAYHRIVHEWTDIIREADKMGIWGMSTIEHHFHSEGFEVGPNPGVLNAHWADKVTNTRVGALGYVMSTQDPIRVAEETAIIDHLTNGKYFVGFSRGYQSRWTNVLGQFVGAEATLSTGDAADLHNREVFEERVEQVLACWTQESVNFDGRFYKAPFPASGMDHYPGAELARQAGAHGEVDEKGLLRRVSVVPKPYQKPYPPVFMAVARSRPTIEFAAKHGFRPTYFNSTDSIVEMAQIYVEEAAKHGHHFRYGERQNAVRHTRIGKTRADFENRIRAWDFDIYRNFYTYFGNHNVGRPSDDTETAFREMMDTGFFVGGTADDAVRYWQGTLKRVPLEYITLIWHWAQQPKDELLWEMRQFMERVVPELDVPDYSVAAE